ncbi:MAG: carbonic anhydrase [Rhizobiales bacterium]|nr:carbonic anhydrase [Hyphomicrobiales bacterium]
MSIVSILAQNAKWALERRTEDPDYFARLQSLQTPEYLWIGCSDSRVPANTITGLEPGEVFVHRNVANVVYAADLNCMSVLQYAVEVLQVRQIIVCGHHGCGGVRAALKGNAPGLVNHWLEPIRDLARLHRTAVEACGTERERIDLLCELNVRMQVHHVVNSPIVERAWEAGRELQVHGLVYSLADGVLRNLSCSAFGIEDADPAFRSVPVAPLVRHTP